MNSLRKQQLKTHFLRALLSGALTVIFMYFAVYRGLISVWAGLFIGISIYLLLAFKKQQINNKYFRKTNLFLFSLLNGTVNVVIIMAIAWLGVGLFYMDGDFGLIYHDFFRIFTGTEARLGLAFGLSLNFFFIFFSIINTLIGKNVLGKLFIGKYRTPFEVERVFMFLDMKSSTAIAEEIGHKKFLSLMNDFFYDIMDPINQTKGEIYKYVGDEAIICWKMKNAINQANCLKCYFMIEEKIKSRSDDYLKKYGHVPQFKAGMHGGTVITGELGYTKREIAFMGDVLNTTARIEEACKLHQQDFLVSEKLLAQMDDIKNYKLTEMASVKLRGKENEIKLIAVNKNF